jgi:hypothetical protein
MDLRLRLRPCRNEAAQFPVSYYFQLDDRETSLPGAAMYLFDLAKECSAKGNPAAVRLAATMLGGAVRDYAEIIDELYLGTKSRDTRKILQAYADDHFRDPIHHRDEDRREAA